MTLTDFPAAAATSLAGARALQAWTRSAPTEATVQLHRLGAIHIAFERLGYSAAPVAAVDAVFAIEGGGRCGRIVVDGWLALRLVSAVLGRTADLSLRPLGRAERGVLAALLATTLAELAGDVRLSLGAVPRLSDDIVTVILKVMVMETAASVRLDLPPGWLAARAGAVPFDGASLPVSGSLELASTHLPGLDWASVRPGDAVVFDGFAPLPTSDAWPARLRLGPFAAKTRLDVDGVIHLIEGFQRVAVPTTPQLKPHANRHEEPPMPNPPPNPSPPEGSPQSDAPADVTSVLAAAPVEIVAEIGRVILRGDEVMGLARGHVLALGGARTTTVSVRVGDTLWARGELVDVDGELGVRIVELYDR